MNAMMVLRGTRADYDGWAARAARVVVGRRRACVRAQRGGGVSARRSSRPARPRRGVRPRRAGRRNSARRRSQRRGQRGCRPRPRVPAARTTFSVLDGYYAPARRRPNLTVVTDALVTRVLLEGGRAVGVAFRPDGDEPEDEVRCVREVVLCAGAIGTPHLLQLSGIGPREALAAAGVDVVHEHPSVGANLIDHLANGLLVRTKGVETLASAESLPNLVRWALRGRGPLTSNLGEAVAFVRSRPELSRPDLELLLAPVLFEEEGLKQPTEHGLTLAVVPAGREAREPCSCGRPTRRPARDRPALPQRSGRRGRGDAPARTASRAARPRAGAARVVHGRRDPPGARRAHGRRAARAPRALSQTLYHPAGTCRMGSDAAVGRRSAPSRPRDRRARVADASVMPKLPHGHTNWPTVMIAERARGLVAADSRYGAAVDERAPTTCPSSTSSTQALATGASSGPSRRHAGSRRRADDLVQHVAVRAARDRPVLGERGGASRRAGASAPSASRSVVSIGEVERHGERLERLHAARERARDEPRHGPRLRGARRAPPPRVGPASSADAGRRAPPRSAVLRLRVPDEVDRAHGVVLQQLDELTVALVREERSRLGDGARSAPRRPRSRPRAVRPPASSASSGRSSGARASP